ncbi:hypothetical protein QVD99_006445 [Batrachochytrium dendrobatidis]|nr:hypothetical protein QVD99_006445 [Batrachochytrium dendrobatidis]
MFTIFLVCHLPSCSCNGTLNKSKYINSQSHEMIVPVPTTFTEHCLLYFKSLNIHLAILYKNEHKRNSCPSASHLSNIKPNIIKLSWKLLESHSQDVQPCSLGLERKRICKILGSKWSCRVGLMVS